MITYYDILGIRRDASAEEIRQAYLRLMKIAHPDKHGGANNEFAYNLNRAYDTLKDPEKRRKYDAELNAQQRAAPNPSSSSRQQGGAQRKRPANDKTTGSDGRTQDQNQAGKNQRQQKGSTMPKSITLDSSNLEKRDGVIRIDLSATVKENRLPVEGEEVIFIVNGREKDRITTDYLGRAVCSLELAASEIRGDRLNVECELSTGESAKKVVSLPKDEKPKVPVRKLTLDVSPPLQQDDKFFVNADALVTENDAPLKGTRVEFTAYGEYRQSRPTNPDGRAECTFEIPQSEIRGEEIVVKAISGIAQDTKTTKLPKKSEQKVPLVADKLILRAEGNDGRHSLYLQVVTQDRKPIPGLHVIVKENSGQVVTQGITNERGVVDPHPVIHLQTPGIHYFRIYVEGTALAPEPLRLDGPPRYPRPPEPPREIPENLREYIGHNPFKAWIAGFRLGRQALREQRAQRRIS